MIEDTAALTHDHFLTEGVTLEILPSIEDCEIECRASDISQAFLNVFSNSFKALKGQDEKWIRVSYTIKGQTVLIEVTDSGLGIPPAIRSVIFEPYFTTSTDNHTLGLGLTIARDYLDAHHGTLVLDETSPNTKFIFSLPLADTFNFGIQAGLD